MKIVLSPDPTLRRVCQEIDPTDRSTKRLAAQMAKTMYKNNGVGLAAPQVGVCKRLIVVDCDVESETQNPLALVNPKIVVHSDDIVTGDEGCLSVPGISLPIDRWAWVQVSAYDLEGNEIVYEGGDDLFGRCLQHEIDHLDGLTMFERLDPVMTIEALRLYHEALKRGARPGDTDSTLDSAVRK